MDLVRSPEDDKSKHYENTEKRYRVVLMGLLSCDDAGQPLLVRIANISAGGLAAIVPAGVERGTPVEIDIRHVGKLSGHIAWARENMVGVQFDEAIDPVSMLERRAESARMPALQAQRFVERNRAKLAARVAVA